MCYANTYLNITVLVTGLVVFTQSSSSKVVNSDNDDNNGHHKNKDTTLEIVRARAEGWAALAAAAI